MSRSRLVGSSLCSKLLNWPLARTKLPLKLKYSCSFSINLVSLCWCLALVRTFLDFIGIWSIDPYHSMSKQKILPVEPLIQCGQFRLLNVEIEQ